MDYASDGNLSKFAVGQIADAAEWDGDAKEFIDALVESGFLDFKTDSLRVHGWEDYQLHYDIIRERKERQKEQVRERVEKWRQKNRNGAVTAGNAPVTQSNAPTLPNQTLPNQTLTPLSAKADPGGPSPEDLISLWNSRAHPNLPRVELLTDRRRLHIRARLKEHPGQQFWNDLMDRVNRSPMLRGENGRDWKCSFDWILNVNNMAKILEGNYDLARRSA